jgi:ubiquinone/menaquinone biosynthesis C-methylase UbiE
MNWYKKDFEGVFTEYWKQYLLGGERGIEISILERFLKRGLILDLSCGPGKHIACYSKNQEVIGLDLSKDLLSIAQKECKKKGNYGNVNLIRADMRYLPFKSGVFDNLIHILAFGYFSDAGNESVLAEISRGLKKGGIYIHQNYNHPESLRTLEWKTIYPKVPKGFFKKQEIKYDPKTKRLHVKETIKHKISEEKIERNYQIRHYNLHELKQLFGEHHLTINTIFGPIVMNHSWELEVGKFDEKKEGNITIVSEKK